MVDFVGGLGGRAVGGGRVVGVAGGVVKELGGLVVNARWLGRRGGGGGNGECWLRECEGLKKVDRGLVCTDSLLSG